MMPYLDDAHQELRRVDHLIFVSLKYTRTTDVLINIIHRMIDAYGHMFTYLLHKAKEDEAIDEIPTTPIERSSLIKKIFDDPFIHEQVYMYLLFRQMAKTEYTSENEYRRHVTMITYIHGRKEILNIDLISVYYENMLKLYEQLKRMEAPEPDE